MLHLVLIDTRTRHEVAAGLTRLMTSSMRKSLQTLDNNRCLTRDSDCICAGEMNETNDLKCAGSTSRIS